MLNNEIKDFTFHEFKTDSDNFVKDIAKLLSMGSFAKEARNKEGIVVKKENAAIEYNWQIVSPKPNFELIKRNVTSFEELSGEEYEVVTLDQIARITNRAVIRCKTLAENKEALTGKSIIGEVQKEYAELYLEMYMPRYLCDTEDTDPLAQLDGTIPLCVNPKNGRKEATVRNYHWCLFRTFDNPNKDLSGPMENVIDPVTNELVEFNSASSEWTKLSWFTDFEEVFKSELLDAEVDPLDDTVLRVPVSSSLTNKTKIRVFANVHPNRAAITVVGNPNVDYSDNRYLISTTYIGAIDSFKNSKKDIEGNFGIFTSSSSVPSIPKETRETTDIFSGLTIDKDGQPVTDQWKIYNNQAAPKYDLSKFDSTTQGWVNLGPLSSININNALSNQGTYDGEQTFEFTYRKREVPRDLHMGINGGRTTIVDKNIKVALGKMSSKSLDFEVTYEYGSYTQGNGYNSKITVNIPASDIVTGVLPVKSIVVDKPDGEYTETLKVTISNNDLYQYLCKYIRANLASPSMLDPGRYKTQVIHANGNAFWVGFDEQGDIAKVVGGTQRDAYGNLIDIEYHKTFGIHTANGTTDFAMYQTDSADFWQSHFLMFSSTEQFMKKHMYGKSAYTNEYFADRIKVTHSAEGVRGVLSGLIVIDAESLFPFDELIVNKDFTKDINKAEETYIYLPITAPYCPFANSPNERYGLGLLKELKHNEYDEESRCEGVILNISEIYKDSLYFTNGIEEFELLETAHNGLTITWESLDDEVIVIGDEQLDS